MSIWDWLQDSRPVRWLLCWQRGCVAAGCGWVVACERILPQCARAYRGPRASSWSASYPHTVKSPAGQQGSWGRQDARVLGGWLARRWRSGIQHLTWRTEVTRYHTPFRSADRKWHAQFLLCAIRSQPRTMMAIS